MYHLRLTRALSYSGVVEATQKKPDVYVEDQATADKAVATGYFQLIEGSGELFSDGAGEAAGHLDEAALAKMKFDELKRLAADMGVDTKGLKSKDDYAKAIAAVKVQAGPDEGGEDENAVDYGEGSLTMQELQEEM